MVVNPQLTSPPFPYLPVRVMVGQETFEATAEATTLVDTGYTGDLIAPRSLLSERDPESYRGVVLGNGSRDRGPVYRGAVQIGGFSPIRYKNPRPWRPICHRRRNYPAF